MGTMQWGSREKLTKWMLGPVTPYLGQVFQPQKHGGGDEKRNYITNEVLEPTGGKKTLTAEEGPFKGDTSQLQEVVERDWGSTPRCAGLGVIILEGGHVDFFLQLGDQKHHKGQSGGWPDNPAGAGEGGGIYKHRGQKRKGVGETGGGGHELISPVVIGLRVEIR